MKKHLIPFLSGMALLVTIACAPPSVMVPKQAPASIASIQPEPGKAALVVTRTTSFGGAISFKTYLDKTFIGYTRGKCYFAKLNIEPGEKYVSSWGENGLAVKVPFEAGKVYFIQHNVSMGAFRARVVVEAVNAKRLDGGDLAGINFYEFDAAKNDVADLTEAEFKDVIQNADTLVLNSDGTETLIPAKK